MILGQMLAVRSIPDDWPFVHPKSIYDTAALSDDRAEQRAREALVAYGLPWLSQFPDHDAIVEAFRARGPLSIGMSPAGALDIADMLAALGRDAEARQTLEDYVGNPILRSHAVYLAEYLSKKGHPDLAMRIRTKDLFQG